MTSYVIKRYYPFKKKHKQTDSSGYRVATATKNSSCQDWMGSNFTNYKSLYLNFVPQFTSLWIPFFQNKVFYFSLVQVYGLKEIVSCVCVCV